VESRPHRWTRVAPLTARSVRDALVVVRTMHELAVAETVTRLTEERLDEMRSAARVFADAVRAADVEAAVTADDAFHDIPVRVLGNDAVAATIARYTPVVRRLEVQRFRSAHGSGSVALHARLVSAFERQDADAAVKATTATWNALLEHLGPDEAWDLHGTDLHRTDLHRRDVHEADVRGTSTQGDDVAAV
jgi:DNA-binding GntR family transcriptional regulator